MFILLMVVVYFSKSASTAEPVIYYLTTFDGTDNKTPLFEEYASEINFNVPLVFIIHGWIENSDHGYYLELTKTYNGLGKNVIAVDWEKLANDPYIEAVSNTKIVGDHAGKFLVSLLEFGLDPTKIHIVGHSLGAHIAGFMGKYMNKFSRMKVGRITGLDPAGWGFYKLYLFDNKLDRLDKDDANLVVVLNTSIFFGIWRSLGKVTFYANHGIYQPGCPFDDDPNISPKFCSHQRSMSYMIESLKSNKFVGRKSCYGQTACRNHTLVLGENIPCRSDGIYYFTTNVKKPYGRG